MQAHQLLDTQEPQESGAEDRSEEVLQVVQGPDSAQGAEKIGAHARKQEMTSDCE